MSLTEITFELSGKKNIMKSVYLCSNEITNMEIKKLLKFSSLKIGLLIWDCLGIRPCWKIIELIMEEKKTLKARIFLNIKINKNRNIRRMITMQEIIKKLHDGNYSCVVSSNGDVRTFFRPLTGTTKKK